MTIVVTVAFIVSVTTFFTKVFGLKGVHAFIAAALVAVVAVEYPVFILAFPQLAPWLDPIATLVGVLLSAAGSYDFINGMAKKLGSSDDTPTEPA